ncbi:hypothetical protein [Cystobacter ferrugineus]|uniref:FtsH ternary system domain-containing protein n=1 Tax=Cystobacter ferrugineus TaxID=83449 RepID=A0A1L9BKI6_9BACT|nr:hypothetical protein [Cystobacter ferrugineus]OJH42791.1 hypothetical protein BON30_06345 [Cystobacter ferrugineus]
MMSVSPSEHALLSLARAIVDSGQYASVEDLLLTRREVPPKLGPRALHVLRDLLAKGVVLALVRRGGWRRQRHLHDGQGVEGRLWQRHAAPPLHFSSACVRTLQWLTSQPLGRLDREPLEVVEPLTLADELFLYLCCHLVAGTPCGPSVGAQPLFRHSALCRLGFPELLGAPPPGFNASAFTPLLVDKGLVLEALQADLARRWLRIEESKRRVSEPADMVALGSAQEAVLSAFLEALEAARRRDLAGFLLEAGRGLVGRPATLWVEGLSPLASLRARAEASRAAGAWLRSLARLARWDSEHRAVRFFDDDYDAAQFLLSQWSAFGEAGFRLAAERERALSSLGPFEAVSS